MDLNTSRQQAPRPAVRGWVVALRWFSWGLRILAGVFGGFLIVLYVLQSRMIFPGASTQGTPSAKVQPRNGAEQVALNTPSGDRVVALFGPALSREGRPLADAPSRPALVYFYGNAMCLADCDREFERFRRLGLNVLIADYLGYGLSGGEASELGCRETADACFGYLRSRGFASKSIIAAGWSMGGAVAIDLASRWRPGGLMAFSTFTSIRDMGRTIFPIPLPRWFFRHRFDNLRKISTLDCPILLGHGRRDSLIPFSMFERLVDATNPPASQIIIDEADHNDFYEIGGDRLFSAIAKFVSPLQPDS